MPVPTYIQVILPLRLEWEPCYRVPEDVRVNVGDRVRVRFANQEYIGTVSAVGVTPDIDESKIMSILSLEENLLWAVQCGECWIILHGEEPAGFFCLREGPAEHLDEIRDGKWHYDGSYGILDSFAVIPRYRGSGLSDRMIREAEPIKPRSFFG